MPNTLTNMLFAAALAVGATTTAQAGAPVFPDSRALGFGLPGEPHEALKGTTAAKSSSITHYTP